MKFFVAHIFVIATCIFSCRSVRMNMQTTVLQSSSSTSQTTANLQWVAEQYANTPPGQRGGHTSVVLGNQLLFFGGCNLDEACYNDLNAYNLQTSIWSPFSATGNPPSIREGHSTSLIGSNMYLFGGTGSSTYYNDLYKLDLEKNTWTSVTFPGTVPSGRTNHGAVVDQKGRIIIFGGFTEAGYSNDVYILDPILQIWSQPVITGTAPSARESFSMTRVRNAIWIFGGFTDGGVLNDLYVLDLDSMAWKTVTTSGTAPVGRQGHEAILQEQNLYIFGGCNFKIDTCYSDTYYLNIDSLVWNQISDASTAALTPREAFASSVVGANIYLFGGCKLTEQCYNDMFEFNTGVPCPNQCSNNGVCRNNRCVCTPGFFENDCSLQVQCAANCNNHGQCRTNGQCACYPGYTDDTCSTLVNCPSNCTDEYHGTCQTSGQCQCLSGLSGDSCQIGQPATIPCPNSCSNQGTCNTQTGVCVCDVGFTGNDCSSTVASSVVQNNPAPSSTSTTATNPNVNGTKYTFTEIKFSKAASTPNPPTQNQAPATPNPNPQPATPDSQTPQAIDNSDFEKTVDPSQTSQGVLNTQLKNQQQQHLDNLANPTGRGSGSQTVVQKLTAEMFSEAFNQEKNIQDQKQQDAYLDELSQCPNSCSYDGLCKDAVCYCNNGYTGEDCSISSSQNLVKGEPVENILKYSGVCFLVGSIIGVFSILALLRKAEESEYMNIKPKPEDEEDES